MSYCGFTFMELLVLIVIVGTLAAIAIPAGLSHIEKARIVRAIGEIRGLEKDITAYEVNNETLPETLNNVGRGTLKDPWGNSYEYLQIAGVSVPEGGHRGGGSIMDEVRKDRFLVPVNSDYDLYSKGKDGESRPPFNSSKAQDDIVRANDGGYVGLASEF
jgi:general secretion pathway protein G